MHLGALAAAADSLNVVSYEVALSWIIAGEEDIGFWLVALRLQLPLIDTPHFITITAPLETGRG
jgi:hypothetical protein